VTAALIVDVLAGGHTRNVAVGRDLDETRTVLDGYVATQLLATDEDASAARPTGASR
jgi:hypothetical protein